MKSEHLMVSNIQFSGCPTTTFCNTSTNCLLTFVLMLLETSTILSSKVFPSLFLPHFLRRLSSRGIWCSLHYQITKGYIVLSWNHNANTFTHAKLRKRNMNILTHVNAEHTWQLKPLHCHFGGRPSLKTCVVPKRCNDPLQTQTFPPKSDSNTPLVVVTLCLRTSPDRHCASWRNVAKSCSVCSWMARNQTWGRRSCTKLTAFCAFHPWSCNENMKQCRLWVRRPLPSSKFISALEQAG